MNQKLKLTREWKLGQQIGGGGFGKVYEATSSNHDHAVAKLVPKAPGAQRELLFVDLNGARNVVPIIDSGETQDSWVLIMPRAEKSLRAHLDASPRPHDRSEMIAILSDITTALADMDGKVVHRDLKPDNVLLLNGTWCLADFGISRYAEATTAPDTQKYALSAPYAAPERWRAERATIATDVYSLGIIGFELTSKSLPFGGPGLQDFREQHLHQDPPDLQSMAAGVKALIMECLYKAPEARPRPANILARLARIDSAKVSPGLDLLRSENLAEVGRRADASRRESALQSEKERRKDLLRSATTGMLLIGDSLRDAIVTAAPTADVRRDATGWSVSLNGVQIRLESVLPVAFDPWQGWEAPAFDVVAHTALSVRMPPNRHSYEGRGHALWFCDAQKAANYQWFETAFMISPLIPRRGPQNPFALEPNEASAKALWTGVGEFEVAWPFTPVTVDDLDEFIDRWAGWFAAAARGQLQHPGTMPEKVSAGSWRKK